LTTLLRCQVSRIVLKSSRAVVESNTCLIKSETVPQVSDNEANSSLRVVRKLIHHCGRGIAFTIVLAVNWGGIEKPLRVSRIRFPAIGVSTVKNNVSKPAASARFTRS